MSEQNSPMQFEEINPSAGPRTPSPVANVEERITRMESMLEKLIFAMSEKSSLGESKLDGRYLPETPQNNNRGKQDNRRSSQLLTNVLKQSAAIEGYTKCILLIVYGIYMR